jgi:hypothetical protein
VPLSAVGRKGPEADAVGALGGGSAKRIQDRWQQVDVADVPVDHLANFLPRILHDQRNSDLMLVHRPLVPNKTVFSKSFAVIRRYDDQAVIVEVKILKAGEKFPQLGIQEGDRPIVLGDVMTPFDIGDRAPPERDVIPERVVMHQRSKPLVPALEQAVERLRRHVGRVGIHIVDKKKEWRACRAKILEDLVYALVDFSGAAV